MPAGENHIKIVVDDHDYQTLKLAATIDDSANLKAWATKTLVHHARKLVTDFKARTTPAPAEPEGAGP